LIVLEDLVAGACNHLKLRFLSTYRPMLDELATEGPSRTVSRRSVGFCIALMTISHG
jgi:hypothetical protein